MFQVKRREIEDAVDIGQLIWPVNVAHIDDCNNRGAGFRAVTFP